MRGLVKKEDAHRLVCSSLCGGSERGPKRRLLACLHAFLTCAGLRACRLETIDCSPTCCTCVSPPGRQSRQEGHRPDLVRVRLGGGLECWPLSPQDVTRRHGRASNPKVFSAIRLRQRDRPFVDNTFRGDDSAAALGGQESRPGCDEVAPTLPASTQVRRILGDLRS